MYKKHKNRLLPYKIKRPYNPLQMFLIPLRDASYPIASLQRRNMQDQPDSVLKSETVMLMHGATSWVVHEPRRDARAVEAAEALQAGHGHPDRKLLETDGALGVVHAVLFRRRVRVHAAPARYGRRGRRHSRRWRRAAVRAVRLDACRNVLLSQRFKIRERRGWQLSVAYWTLVFFGNLRRRRQSTVSRRCDAFLK